MPESADHSAPAFPAQHAPTPNHPRGWFNYLRWPLFFLLVGGSAATGYYSLPRQPTERDRIGLIPDKMQQDFGRVGQGEFLQGEFTLTNKYPAPVEIKEVLTGCSCQIPVVSQKSLGPGEKSVIKVAWATGARRGRAVDPLTVIHTIPGQPGALGRFTLLDDCILTDEGGNLKPAGRLGTFDPRGAHDAHHARFGCARVGGATAET